MDRRTLFGVLLLLVASGCREPAPPPYATWTPAPSPPVVAGPNAFDAYAEAALAAEAATKAAEAKDPSRGDLLTRVYFTPALRRDALAVVAGPLSRLEQAVSQPCTFLFVPRKPFEKAPYQAGWRLLARCMLWKTQDALVEERWDDAIREAVDLMKFGFDLTQGGATDASLGLAVINEAREALAPSLDQMPAASLNTLSLRVGNLLEAAPGLEPMIANERLQMLGAVQFVQDAYRDRTLAELEAKLGSDVKNAVEYLDAMRPKDRKERPGYFQGFAQEAEDHCNWLRQVAAVPAAERKSIGDPKTVELRPWRRLAKQFFLAADPLLDVHDATLARTRLLCLEAQIQRAIKSTGSAPKDLSEFRADLKTDPYTGQEFVYRAAGGVYSLYSVGPDFEDDGGDTDESFTTPDLRLERAPG